MQLRVLRDLDVLGKLVILRADIDADPNNTASIRLLTIRPSVDYLFDKGAKRIIIIGHRGRPNGFDPKFSTQLLIDTLSKILSRKISFALDFNNIPKEELVLFENLRFWKGERDKDQSFAQKIAKIGEIYVSDAFGTFHRNDASIVILPLMFPSACGIQAELEFNVLSKVIENPEHPFVAITGGAKIEDKVNTIQNLSHIADNVLVGGLLPLEIIKRNLKFSSNVLIGDLMENAKDISKNSIDSFVNVIRSAKTIVWNGTVGYVEEGFTHGTDSIIEAIIQSKSYSVVGGGDTTQYLFNKNLQTHFSHVSTGGGAMLAFLSGNMLPGFEVLKKV